jgi:DNA-binding GntR family transcriptional regulator
MTKSKRLSGFKTKTEVVYDFLKKNILDGRYQPGEKIVISVIARQLDVSDIPIREAIKRLQTEGLLDITPHVGAKVVEIDQDEFEQITLIRAELEGLATRLSINYLSEKDFKELDRLNLEGDVLVKNKSYRQLAELNRKFHFTIYRSLPHNVITKMISDLWDKARMQPHVFTYSVDRCRQSQKEHKLVVKALKKGDGHTASEIVKKQKIDASNHLWKFLEKRKIQNENIKSA